MTQTNWQPSKIMTDQEFAQANANMPAIEKYHALAQENARKGANSAARAFITLARQAMVALYHGEGAQTPAEDNRLNEIYDSLIDIEIEVK